jgi:general stress protein 26
MKLNARKKVPSTPARRGGSQARTNGLDEHSNLERVWDIIESVGVCMLTTQAGGRLRARPVEPRPDRKSGLIFVVTDVRSAKQDEIEAKPDVNLVFIDAQAKAYLSITARACVTRDISKIEQVWRLTDKAWWPGGATDPNVCLLRIEPQTGELWDGPASTAVTVFEFGKAFVTGAQPALGENRKVTVRM